MTHKNQFGLFIHWGLYSLTGLHEQAIARYGMAHEEYEALMHSFHPKKFDPDAWVLLAKKAGMKYICFTAKHHDGFCLWDTKQTDYNVMNTPYGKDVLKMLADACHRHGMRLSLYYSNPDWHHPFGYNPASSHQWKAKYPDQVDTEQYRAYIKAQIKELLTGYGEIYTFFWDIPPKIEDPSMNELIRSLQPQIFINDRGWGMGDFATPEREYQVTPTSRFERMTEACNSVGQQSWGYREREDFFSTAYLCRAIDRYMALGASYLLNVGPNADGVIEGKYLEKLLKVSDWYQKMEGCLEETEPDLFDYTPSDKNVIVTKKNGKTYFHCFKGLTCEALSLQNYPSLPKRVRLMNTHEALPFDLMYFPEGGFRGDPNGPQPKKLHIYGIDVDSLGAMPIVIEVEWE